VCAGAVGSDMGQDGHGGSSVGSGARYIATILLWFGLRFLLRSPEHRLQALSAVPGPPSWSLAYSKPGVPTPAHICVGAHILLGGLTSS
jgi:hypothetical protein